MEEAYVGLPALVQRFDRRGSLHASSGELLAGAAVSQWVADLVPGWLLAEGAGPVWSWSRSGRQFVTSVAVSPTDVVTITQDVTAAQGADRVPGLEDGPRFAADPVAGLPTLDYALHRVEIQVSRMAASSGNVGIGMLDVGVSLSAEAWQGLVARVAPLVRAGDTLAKGLESELIVVFSGSISEAEARLVARRIVGEVCAIEPNSDPVVGLVFAAATTSALQMVDEARVGVGLARQVRGDGIWVVDESDRATLQWTARRVDQIRLAIEHDLFEVNYQPVVSLATGEVCSVEALARLDHPTEGRIEPDQFVAVAERTGLIGRVTRRVVARVLDDLERWCSGHAVGPPVVAVNVSAIDLLADGFVDELLAEVERRAVVPERLRVELTETAVVADVDRAAELLARIRSAGLGVSLDDFGTGASTLGVLRSLPVDCLKVDRSLVDGVGTDDRADAVIRLIVGLARTFGCSVIVEGVEHDRQHQVLRDLECDYGQGFLFGRPMTREDLEARLGSAGN